MRGGRGEEGWERNTNGSLPTFATSLTQSLRLPDRVRHYEPTMDVQERHEMFAASAGVRSGAAGSHSDISPSFASRLSATAFFTMKFMEDWTGRPRAAQPRHGSPTLNLARSTWWRETLSRIFMTRRTNKLCHALLRINGPFRRTFARPGTSIKCLTWS